MRRPETFDLNLDPPFCAGVASRPAITQNGGSRLKLRRGLAQPVPGAAGTSTGLLAKQAHRSETRH